MIQNYLKVAFRALWWNNSYTLLNGAGLAAGIGACLLIFLLIRFELSFDNFHPDRDRTYRLVSVPYRAGSPLGMEVGVPLAVAQALRVDFPQLEKVAAIFGRDAQVTVPDAEQGGAGMMANKEGRSKNSMKRGTFISPSLPFSTSSGSFGWREKLAARLPSNTSAIGRRPWAGPSNSTIRTSIP